MGMRRLYRIVKDTLKLITTPSKHIEERDLEVMGTFRHPLSSSRRHLPAARSTI
jgi:hypothetical protein